MNFGQVLAAVGRGFRNVTTFQGRNTRAQFWPFALFVYLASTALTMITVGMMISWMANPQNNVASYDYAPNTPGIMTQMFPVSVIVRAITLFLYAAASTRRLHDRGLTGRWLVIPVINQVALFSCVGWAVSSMADPGSPEISGVLFGATFLIEMINLIASAVLIVQFALAGTPGANRFGPPPDTAV